MVEINPINPFSSQTVSQRTVPTSARLKPHSQPHADVFFGSAGKADESGEPKKPITLDAAFELLQPMKNQLDKYDPKLSVGDKIVFLRALRKKFEAADDGFQFISAHKDVAMLKDFAHDIRNIFQLNSSCVGIYDRGGEALLVDCFPDFEKKLDNELRAIKAGFETYKGFIEKTPYTVEKTAQLAIDYESGIATYENKKLAVKGLSKLKDLETKVKPSELYTVIVNPIGNAIKYGGKNISVEFDVEDNPVTLGKSLKIQVDDDGKGMAPEYLAKVVSGESAQGTGYGMKRIREITAQHGGKEEFLSWTQSTVTNEHPKPGTRFTVWLPLEKA